MPDFLGDHLIFILVIVCALVPQTTSSVESDAKNLMSEISSMTSSTLDVADRFNLITSKAAAITKLLGPIGTMVATSAEIVLQPQTDEMKAINILSKEMKAEFLGLNQKVAKHSEMFSFELALRDYKGRVELVLNSIEYELEDLINPDYEMRQQYVKPWKDDCESKTHSPLEVLKYLDFHLRKHCQTPTKEHAKNFISALPLIAHMPNMTAHDKLMLLEEVDHWPYSSVQQRLLTDDKSEPVAMPLANPAEGIKCYLLAVMNHHDWNRIAFDSFMEVVIADVIKAKLLAGLCVPFITSAAHVPEKLRNIDKLVNNMLDHVKNWRYLKVESAWPEVVQSEAKKNIKKDVTDPLNYHSLANVTLRNVESRGNEDYFHQVFITKNFGGTTEWHEICPKDSCFVIKNHHYVNVVVTRFEKTGSKERAEAGSKWLVDSKSKIEKIMEENCKKDNLHTMLSLIDKEVGGIFKEDRPYKTCILLHHQKLFGRQLAGGIGVEFSEQFAELTSVDPHATVEHRYYQDLISWAELHKLFCFL